MQATGLLREIAEQSFLCIANLIYKVSATLKKQFADACPPTKSLPVLLNGVDLM